MHFFGSLWCGYLGAPAVIVDAILHTEAFWALSMLPPASFLGDLAHHHCTPYWLASVDIISQHHPLPTSGRVAYLSSAGPPLPVLIDRVGVPRLGCSLVCSIVSLLLRHSFGLVVLKPLENKFILGLYCYQDSNYIYYMRLGNRLGWVTVSLFSMVSKLLIGAVYILLIGGLVSSRLYLSTRRCCSKRDLYSFSYVLVRLSRPGALLFSLRKPYSLKRHMWWWSFQLPLCFLDRQEANIIALIPAHHRDT